MYSICIICILLTITGRGFSGPVNDALKVSLPIDSKSLLDSDSTAVYSQGADLIVQNEQQPLEQSQQQETSLLAENTQGHENQSERQARGLGLSFGGHGGNYGLYNGHHGHVGSYGGHYGGHYGGPYVGGFGYGGYGGYGGGYGHSHGYHHDHYHHYPHYGHYGHGHGYGF